MDDKEFFKQKHIKVFMINHPCQVKERLLQMVKGCKCNECKKECVAHEKCEFRIQAEMEVIGSY